VRVESVAAGSVGAARGLMAGDIVRDVNGLPLNSLAELKNMMNNPAMKQSSGLRITVERAGKPLVLEYRPLPR
jgi:S1-C subfamily serine protease